VVPATGKPDPAAMAHFLAKHPETARAMAIVDQHPPTAGFADSTYRSLNTFYLVNESGTRTPVRWSLVPLQRALPPSMGLNGLFTPLIRQMRSGPLRWRLMLTVGAPSDPVHDATLPRPAERRAVDAGLLTLTAIDTDRPGNARDITSIRWCCPKESNRLTIRCLARARPSTARRIGGGPERPCCCPRSMSTKQPMTVARERTRYTRLTRILHWLTAALVSTMLLIGFVPRWT
jgi:hypothetical protein